MSESNKTGARQLLNTLFFEAGMATEEMQLKPKLKDEKPSPTGGPERKPIDDKLKELSGLLSKLGLKDVASRLEVDGNYFCFRSTQDQHADDSNILFDLTKIMPLVDKGYAVLDAENDEHGAYKIIILCADTTDDLKVPDADDLEAVKFDNESVQMDAARVDKLAEQLIKQVTS